MTDGVVAIFQKALAAAENRTNLGVMDAFLNSICQDVIQLERELAALKADLAKAIANHAADASAQHHVAAAHPAARIKEGKAMTTADDGKIHGPHRILTTAPPSSANALERQTIEGPSEEER